MAQSELSQANHASFAYVEKAEASSLLVVDLVADTRQCDYMAL